MLPSMVKAKLAGLGSSRVSTTISITGATTGASVVASTWDSVDAGLAGRASLYADQEMATVMQAGGWTPLNFAIGEITSERGNGEGAYTVAVLVKLTDLHSTEPMKWQICCGASPQRMV